MNVFESSDRQIILRQRNISATTVNLQRYPAAKHSYPPYGRLAAPPRWHPKITVYRLAIVLITLGLSTARLILIVRAGSELVITMLGFALYPVIPIIRYTVDLCHSRLKSVFPRIFESDLCSYFSTSHDTEEQEDPITDDHVPIRGYDMLFTSFNLLYGITKPALVYFGFTTVATIFEYIGTLCIGIGFYCFELYGKNPLGPMPRVFLVDYSGYLNKFKFAYEVGIMVAKCIAWLLVRWAWILFDILAIVHRRWYSAVRLRMDEVHSGNSLVITTACASSISLTPLASPTSTTSCASTTHRGSLTSITSPISPASTTSSAFHTAPTSPTTPTTPITPTFYTTLSALIISTPESDGDVPEATTIPTQETSGFLNKFTYGMAVIVGKCVALFLELWGRIFFETLAMVWWRWSSVRLGMDGLRRTDRLTTITATPAPVTSTGVTEEPISGDSVIITRDTGDRVYAAAVVQAIPAPSSSAGLSASSLRD
ncbi:hypothetical protein BDQ17DRAFT_1349820 [Cyathus striatus]|nr:hypothetical protein BDQ17DRAFT_1349820 [Cyathus striatus]